MKEIKARLQSDTPSFFKKVRLIGICLVTVGGAVAAAPIALPASLVTLAGYMAFIGATAVSVAQLAVSDTDKLPKNE